MMESGAENQEPSRMEFWLNDIEHGQELSAMTSMLDKINRGGIVVYFSGPPGKTPDPRKRVAKMLANAGLCTTHIRRTNREIRGERVFDHLMVKV